MRPIAPEDRIRVLLEEGRAEEAGAEAIRWLGPEVLEYLVAEVGSEIEAAAALSRWAEDVWRRLPDAGRESSLRDWSSRIAYREGARARNLSRPRGRRPEATAASRLAHDVWKAWVRGRTMAGMTPEERIRDLAARGDLQQAATEGLRWLGPEVLGYLAAMVRSETDAAEVFSQFAEDLWRGLPGFRWESSLRTWAYRIAYHAAARFARDPYRQRGQRFETTMASRIADDVRRSSVLRQDQREQQLAALRAELDPEERTLLILRVDRKLSWREVSDVLGAQDEGGKPPDEPALRKRFERIKDKLGKKAREAGLIE